jgi:hypothetical protein
LVVIVWYRSQGPVDPDIMLILFAVVGWWFAMNSETTRWKTNNRYQRVRIGAPIVYCLYLPINVCLLLITIDVLPVPVIGGGLALMAALIVVLSILITRVLRDRLSRPTP